MGRRLTDKERKQILADYVSCRNYSETARRHNISKTAVRNIVNADARSSEMFQQKAEENTQDVLAFMDSQRETKKRLIGKILAAMEAKAENVDTFTNIKDLATAYGIILDKELKYREIKRDEDGNKDPLEIVIRRPDDA